MVNEHPIHALDLVYNIDDGHWCEEVFVLHLITAPGDDAINIVVWMAMNEVDYHNLCIEEKKSMAKNFMTSHDLLWPTQLSKIITNVSGNDSARVSIAMNLFKCYMKCKLHNTSTSLPCARSS